MPSRIVVSKTNWIRIPLRGYFSCNFLVGVSDNLCMTLPRQVVPGRDYMITRRCSERRFFLRPDDDTNNAFIYCLALDAKRAKVQTTLTVAMSNHHHTGIHDPDGNFSMASTVTSFAIE